MRTTGDLIIEPRQARDLVITRTFAARDSWYSTHGPNPSCCDSGSGLWAGN